MSDTYINQKDGKVLSFNYDFVQTFYHDIRSGRGMPEYAVVAEYMEEPPENRAAILEVLLFLKRFAFATVDHIETMMRLKGCNVDLPALLNKCVEKYYLNFFTISKYDIGEVPDDAFRVYCLDSRAIYILTHFSSVDSISWFTTDNIRSIELVTKYLATGEFYQNLSEKRPESVKDFYPLYDATIGKRMIRFSGTFTCMNGYTPLDYIFEVVRSYDLPGPWQKKVSEQIAPFDERFWQKYYDTKPMYLFLTENLEQGREAAEIFFRITSNSNFLVTTDAAIRDGSLGVWEFNPDTKTLVESTSSIFGN